jgi:hypothetical protein
MEQKKRGCEMDAANDNNINNQDRTNAEDDAIDTALLQMEVLYKSRCVQPPRGTNVTVREIKKDK